MTIHQVFYLISITVDDEIVPLTEVFNQARFNYYLRTRIPVIMPGISIEAMTPQMLN